MMKKYVVYGVLGLFCSAGAFLFGPLEISVLEGTTFSSIWPVNQFIGERSRPSADPLNGVPSEVLSASVTPDTISEPIKEYDPQMSIDAVSSEIYVVLDAKTVVLPGSVVEGFLRSDCVASETDCLPVLPCVDVSEIKSYTENRLSDMLLGLPSVSEARNENGSFYYRTDDWVIDTDTLFLDLVSGLSERIEAYRKQVCAHKEYSPETEKKEGKNLVVQVVKRETFGTDGLYASRYIEIDDSQQHLFLWENGAVIRDYEVSGFYDQYAVYGVFTIRNKASNAWSPIAKKWMPWWMAYHYDTRQDAWLGIHELVYWTDDFGIYHEESSASIGKKKSGGCIRLDRGMAEELYRLVEVGTPVLIHQ